MPHSFVCETTISLTGGIHFVDRLHHEHYATPQLHGCRHSLQLLRNDITNLSAYEDDCDEYATTKATLIKTDAERAANMLGLHA